MFSAHEVSCIPVEIHVLSTLHAALHSRMQRRPHLDHGRVHMHEVDVILAMKVFSERGVVRQLFKLLLLFPVYQYFLLFCSSPLLGGMAL